MGRTTFRLPRNVIDAIKKLALEQHASYSDVIRAAIHRFSIVVQNPLWLHDVRSELNYYAKLRKEEVEKFGDEMLTVYLTKAESAFLGELAWKAEKSKALLLYYMIKKYLEAQEAGPEAEGDA